MSDLESRIKNLEAQFAELKDLKTGPQGPRGPAGPIDAAVTQAAAECRKITREFDERYTELLARTERQFNETVQTLRREISQMRKEFSLSMNEGLKNAVDSQILHVLHDYGVVSSHDNKVIQVD